MNNRHHNLAPLSTFLLVFAIVINALGLFFPCLQSTFSPFYGSIAKHMALNHNWTNLYFEGHDWLDKPHFPFWITALSFTIFGVNDWSYILPGFIFHLIGIYYTYKLAKLFYNQEIALVAALLTATSMHLMMSAIDVRAEAFLIGQIMPACYYFIKYDRHTSFKYLILGSLFTALAMMTKGVFVIITIFSGLSCLWLYHKKFTNFIKPKWLVAIILSLILITPELYSLYVQFDLHPEKLIFNTTHVSGIKWYFWGSQFGRFLNTGPINNAIPMTARYLYFVYTMLWAYLPWWPLFFAAIFYIPRKKLSPQDRDSQIFLFGSFFVTFIIFSITKFQLDHYTNILFPFASIITAYWLMTLTHQHKVVGVVLIIAILLMILTLVLGYIALSITPFICMIILNILGFIILFLNKSQPWQKRVLIYPTIAISLAFIFLTLVNGTGYVKYDPGYQAALYLNKTDTNNTIVIGYQTNLLGLDLHSDNPYFNLPNGLNDDSAATQLSLLLKQYHQAYLVINPQDLATITTNYKKAKVIATIRGTTIETYMRNLYNKQLAQHLDSYLVVYLQ